MGHAVKPITQGSSSSIGVQRESDGRKQKAGGSETDHIRSGREEKRKKLRRNKNQNTHLNTNTLTHTHAFGASARGRASALIRNTQVE